MAGPDTPVHAGKPREPLVALTFDDGPGDWTETILDLLGTHGARATLFVLGGSIEGREDVLNRAAGSGHELGNHTWSHRHPAELTDDELRGELVRTGRRIEEVAHVRPRLVRPPYGEDAERVARVAGSLRLGPTVLWSVDPLDWQEPPAEVIVERTLAGVGPGAIVDLHDGFSAGRERGAEPSTVEALRVLLPTLAERGLACVTVSRLLAAV